MYRYRIELRALAAEQRLARKSDIEQLLSRGISRVTAACPHDNGNKMKLASLGGRAHAKARLRGRTRFQPCSTVIETDKAIGISQGKCAVAYRIHPCGAEFEYLVVPHQLSRHYRDIACTRNVIHCCVVKSGSVFKMRRIHFELRRSLVHPCNKGLLAPAYIFGKRNGGIIRRGYHGAFNKCFNAHLLARREKDLRTAHSGSFFAHRHIVLE